MISLAFCVLLVRGLKEPPPLCAGEPVPQPSTEFLHAFHAPNACCEIGTEQAIVGSLVGQSAHSRQPQVDGCRGNPNTTDEQKLGYVLEQALGARFSCPSSEIVFSSLWRWEQLSPDLAAGVVAGNAFSSWSASDQPGNLGVQMKREVEHFPVVTRYVEPIGWMGLETLS
jgi:hypothetical protein